MPHRHATRLLHRPTGRSPARVGLVWALMLALVVYGYSGVLLQILGPMHRHAEPVASVSVLPRPVIELVATLIQWHERAQAKQTFFAHANERVHNHPQNQVHDHGLFARHHHDADDHSVVALDAPSAHASDGLSAFGSATLPLCISPVLTLPAAAACPGQWTPAGEQRWRSAELKLFERPPKV